MHKRRSKTRLAGNLEYNLAKGEGILKSIYSHRDKINQTHCKPSPKKIEFCYTVKTSQKPGPIAAHIYCSCTWINIKDKKAESFNHNKTSELLQKKN